mmetsp:Transcript_31763/g.57498  ORF Transcript_31763/g.57498 Transcript_31763/m.57498 type:complete len:312 (+) Transcript_31763:26-961(+)|eukprot:CAMPEP_0201880144 /NCGR_PEP_ID=MMETSP0902-20130614/10838_1 /ASSEMBLY_ACC=CAM_ASM_000551 /TAXON_ID=420261 /ORGANISM="Thalassiosira antarctica, Strain CCMP982" /LENGTH=311 /DNA_ID=CAMNT_0048408121 /DNA_START=14 /DNA_END=949 /DNA_ORIENTATION=-
MVKFSHYSLSLLSALAAAPRAARASIFESSTSKSSASNGKGAKSRKKDKDPFNVEIDIKYSDCNYELTFSFEHDRNLPLGAENCVEGAFAPDGLPYLAPREFSYKFSDEIYKETGFASHSLDYQACGHPPFGIFTTSHYDMHFYTDPIEVRAGRTCNQPLGAPICIPDTNAQTTESGKAFFNVATIWELSSNGTVLPNIPANMPANFTCDIEAAVPASGTHCWDFLTNPNSVESWVDPVLIMGTYDAKIAFWEPMAPLSFVTGVNDTYYSAEVNYQGQTIKTLPTEYSIEYDATTGRATIILNGVKSSCKI